MDSWPADDRKTNLETTSEKRKSKDKGKEGSWAFPLVEYGSLTAATLHWEAARLDWSFVTGSYRERKLIPKGNPLKVFPETRHLRKHNFAIPLLQRAEQGANFLRTYYPDIDVPTELIRDEIIQDAHAIRALETFDPYTGNMLEILCHSGTQDNSAFLAFPMGDSFRELNLSPLNYSKRDHVMLKAVANTIRTFQTPIQQISTPCPSTEDDRQTMGTVLGVRTYASTSILEATVARPTSQSSSIQTKEIITVLRSDISDKRAVDITMPTSRRTLAFVINDEGAVYKCSAPQGDKLVQLVHPVSPVSDLHGDRFWRLGQCRDEENCLFISSEAAYHLDFRTQGSVSNLYSRRYPGELLTSVEGLQEDHMIRLTTNRDILWIDDRHTKKPVLGIKHGRNYDRTLAAKTRILGGVPLTFLTSRRNGLLTVYDVSRSDCNSLVHLHASPYALPSVYAPDARHLGQVIFQHPSDTNDSDINILQLSESGSLHMMALELSLKGDGSDITHNARRTVPEWSAEVRKLEEEAKTVQTDVGPLGGRSHSVVDLQQAYKKLFYPKEDITGDPDAAYETLEKMPFFWQELDQPIEHTITTYDIAFRSGSEPGDISRNDFFTESALNSRRGYRALVQGRIPVGQLAQHSSWHHDISKFIYQFIPDLREDFKGKANILSQYDLASDTDRPAQSFRRESEAREQLLLDLSLSSDIFAPQHVNKMAEASVDSAFETMSRAAKTMSLQDTEPPPPQFGFLRPVPKGLTDYYANVTKDETAESFPHSTWPLGVRLLMQEWEIGADPYLFTYENPYNTTPGLVRPAPRMAKDRTAVWEHPGRDSAAQFQRPPAIVPATALAPPTIVPSQPLGFRRSLAAARSLDALGDEHRPVLNTDNKLENDARAYASSQDYMTSTQVLPGPHGGRLPPVKKKLVKKRVGGF
ncbi:hypothetical protein AcW1_006160 [Taiwanofungus camphoratus]|nr:hypothetical protein AcV7_008586 [Antrodia cinnamomea]KAI0957933.1 hypothetical protein AcW1_006160 [Antrodia cinnamomea]